METVSDSLRRSAEEIRLLLQELLTKHSSLRCLNSPGDSVYIIGPDWSWQPLGQEGSRLQSRLLEDYRRFSAIIRTLMCEQPRGTLQELENRDRILTAVIEQHQAVWWRTPREACNEAFRALDDQLAGLDRLYDSSEGIPLFIPDTNALLFNPELESWRFPDAPRFALVLVPTVLAEIDQLKVIRTGDLRDKADSVVRRIKGYRGRGRLTEGVTLVRNVSDLVSLAIEPDMTKSLPWLDPNNQDDRLLAAMVEVMRAHPRSPVVLVTRDINLQNKAEFARLPFVEPPARPEESPVATT